MWAHQERGHGPGDGISVRYRKGRYRTVMVSSESLTNVLP